MNSPVDYKKVFSKLCHIKALSNENKFDEIVQNLILYSIVQCPDKLLKSDADVVQNIKSTYGISIRHKNVQSNIDKLLNSKDLLKDHKEKKFIVNEKNITNIKNRIDEVSKLEYSVKTEWLDEVKAEIEEFTDENLQLLWDCLRKYLSNVFEQHGVQAISVLTANYKAPGIEQKGILSIAENAMRGDKQAFTLEVFTKAINIFLITNNVKRRNYIAQLIDSTFTSYALTSDEETVNFLNNRLSNISLFLDTNFIFGVLNLHKNNEDTAALEILDEVKRNKLKFDLVYHPATLSEFRRAFNSKTPLLKSTKWTRESSRVALSLNGLTPIEKLFHTENLENEIDPNIFLEKYEHVDMILKDIGLHEYRPYKISDLEHVEIENDIVKYQDFYGQNQHRAPKNFSQFQHDIIVIREVRSLNRKKNKFLDCSAFFISSDFILAKFEKEYYKKDFEISLIINPSVFLQLLRPFINNDSLSTKRFVETFSIPEFRAFEIDYSLTKSKSLQILNDNFHGVSFETKTKMLRDLVLLDKIKEANDSYDNQVKIIEEQIAIENQILSQQYNDIREKLALADSTKNESDRMRNDADKELQDLRDELSNLKREISENNQVASKHYDKHETVIEINASKAAGRSTLILKPKQNAMNKTKLAIVIIISIVLIYVVYKAYNSNRPSTFSISPDGSTLSVGEPTKDETLAPSIITNNNDQLVTISAIVKINEKIPSSNEIAGVRIKGDSDIPFKSLNDDILTLDNVTIPKSRFVQLEFKFKDNSTKSYQATVFKIDTTRNLAKLGEINISYKAGKPYTSGNVKHLSPTIINITQTNNMESENSIHH